MMRNQHVSTWNNGYYPTAFYGPGWKRRSVKRRRPRAALLTLILLAALAAGLGLNALENRSKTASSIKGYTEKGSPAPVAALAYVPSDAVSPAGSAPDTSASMAAGPSLAAPTAEPVQDDSWMLILVNRWNPLPEGYTVQLVDVPGGVQVDERIYQPLMEMLDAATEAGVGPIVVSGYRTQEKQQSLYDEKINEFLGEGYSREQAIAQAQQWVSVPGTSEHQTGLAVDINGMIWDVYPWLAENSYKYGFILRYPEDKTEITGTQHERWHFRYVGLEAAAEMYDRGLCLEEYLNEIDP